MATKNQDGTVTTRTRGAQAYMPTATASTTTARPGTAPGFPSASGGLLRNQTRRAPVERSAYR